MEGDSRRNTSSDTMNVVQVCILVIKVTLQKALMIKMCPMNVREGKETQNT